jgi:hypothetical protein
VRVPDARGGDDWGRDKVVRKGLSKPKLAIDEKPMAAIFAVVTVHAAGAYTSPPERELP